MGAGGAGRKAASAAHSGEVFLTRDTLDAVAAVRVLPTELDEYDALCKEIGSTRARTLRKAFDVQLASMRAMANQRRSLHHLRTWEEKWRAEQGSVREQGEG